MKNTLMVVAYAVVVLSIPAFADDMAGMNMDAKSMEDMSMNQPAKAAPTAQATGTVKAIDNEQHVVTLAHTAVPSLHWPAMTMGFNATAEQLKDLKIGDRVAFEFRLDGAASTLVSISSAETETTVTVGAMCCRKFRAGPGLIWIGLGKVQPSQLGDLNGLSRNRWTGS